MASVQNPYFSPKDFIKHTLNTANLYGFSPVEQLVEQARKHKHKRGQYSPQHRGEMDGETAELHAALEMYLAENLNQLSQPVMFYHSNVSDGDVSRHAASYRNGKHKPLRFNLQVIGSTQSVADALVIKVAVDILEELGVSRQCVHVNGIGDRDTMAQYKKQLSGFMRDRIDELPIDGQQALKSNPLSALQYVYQQQLPLKEEMPTTLEFLSEANRQHLWELLEYLEYMGTPYEIDPTLVSDSYYDRTLFEVYDHEAEEAREFGDTEIAVTPLARGGRYDELSRALHAREVPAAGITLECKTRDANESEYVQKRKPKQPKVYFAHLGTEAKRRSLHVLDLLRRSRVPAYQALGSDTFDAQLSMAERMKMPYLVILGQKEALEGTVIVRDMGTRAQETIYQDALPEYLHNTFNVR
jgi:histidyl-tRNA synthetase